MINTVFIILFSMNLSIPDSVFLPTNALRINPPEWRFVFEKEESDFVELGYHTTFRIRIKNFYFGAREDYDYEPHVNIQNRYFFSSPYFCLSHNAEGLYRYNSRASFIVRDTLDLYFSAGRIIPDITILPGIHQYRTDSTRHTCVNLPLAFSAVYSGSDGVLTYVGVERPDVFVESENIYRLGVGIMGSRKFVSLGLTSRLIPEFNLRMLITGGAYINLHYGYDIKTPDMFLYLYPDEIKGSSILSIMEKRFILLVDREPINFNFTYSVPDSVFEKNMKITFALKHNYFDISARYFRVFGNRASVFEKVVSKGEIRFHIPLLKNLKYSPLLDIYSVQNKSENVYNIGGKLEYTPGKLQFFWEHNIYTHGTIEDCLNENLTFYKGRRFKFGAKYVF